MESSKYMLKEKKNKQWEQGSMGHMVKSFLLKIEGSKVKAHWTIS